MYIYSVSNSVKAMLLRQRRLGTMLHEDDKALITLDSFSAATDPCACAEVLVCVALAFWLVD